MVTAHRFGPEEVVPAADQRVFFYAATYKDFEMMLLLRGESSVPRIAFSEGVIELISPSINHETLKTRIARLLEAYAEERNVDLDGAGSWTLKNPLVERGAEPDECYSIGGFEGDVPDLAIEVVWTHGGLDKLKLYAKLGVPEVWMWRKGRIEVHRLDGEAYVEARRSVLLPDLDLEHLASFLEVSSQTEAVRAYRRALRET